VRAGQRLVRDNEVSPHGYPLGVPSAILRRNRRFR
jgi:hypothetical protein